VKKLSLPSSPELQAAINKYSPFLMEVRKRLLFILSIFAITMIAGFAFYEQIVKFLVNFLSLQGVNIVFTSPFQFINLAIACGVASGLIAAFPLIINQFLSFLKPALKKDEYQMVVNLLPFAIFLFIVGFAFGAIIMRWQVQIFMGRSVSLGIGNVLDISRLLSVVIMTSTLMGVGFQFPVVLLILMHLGVIKHSQLKKQRPWVYLGSFIFALFLPPDSILADFLLTLPLVILYEITLILNRIFEARRLDKIEAEAQTNKEVKINV
jgi:sec-independent protein translocase protein TatC